MPKPHFYDPSKLSEMIRVNHAGEFGAQRIYEGQLSQTKIPEQKKIIKHMLMQELEHLEYFERSIIENNIRPTILLSLWSKLGFLLGYASASVGYESSMLVTEAVEEVIIDHYQEQIDYLTQNQPSHPLLPKIIKFRQDEASHIDIAQDNDSQNARFHGSLTKIVKTICNAAILISKKV